jgi:hypothetical protein
MSQLVPLQIEVEGWGTLEFMRALPRRGEPWGVLAPLRGTPWEEVISVVPGEALSHALHGYPWPLMRSLGPEPEELIQKLPPETWCIQLLDKSCPQRDKRKCRPGPSLPTCYQVGSLEAEAAMVAYEVAIALGEGKYIIVTEGETFSL